MQMSAKAHVDEIARLLEIVRERVRADDREGATHAKMEIHAHGRMIAKALRNAVMGKSTPQAAEMLRLDQAAVRALGQANDLISRAFRSPTAKRARAATS